MWTVLLHVQPALLPPLECLFLQEAVPDPWGIFRTWWGPFFREDMLSWGKLVWGSPVRLRRAGGAHGPGALSSLHVTGPIWGWSAIQTLNHMPGDRHSVVGSPRRPGRAQVCGERSFPSTTISWPTAHPRAATGTRAVPGAAGLGFPRGTGEARPAPASLWGGGSGQRGPLVALAAHFSNTSLWGEGRRRAAEGEQLDSRQRAGPGPALAAFALGGFYTLCWLPECLQQPAGLPRSPPEDRRPLARPS